MAVPATGADAAAVAGAVAEEEAAPNTVASGAADPAVEGPAAANTVPRRAADAATEEAAALSTVAGPAAGAGAGVAVHGLPGGGADSGAHAGPAVAAAEAEASAAEGGAVLRIAGGERDVPLQSGDHGKWCVLPYLAAGSVEQAEVAASTAPGVGVAARAAGGVEQAEVAASAAPGVASARAATVADAGSGVRIADRGTHLEVTVDGARWGDYHYAAHPVRSYLHPVIGPYGIPMTRAWPLQDGVPGEEHDHVHHRSFWVAHGMVNGVDFWTEAEGHGFQAHGGFEALHSGPAFGRIVQRVSWRKDDPATGTPLLEERRTLTFWNTPASARLLDLTVAFHAAHGAVTFGDTKEGGLCSLRVPEAIKGIRGGVISNAYGGIHEAENWGQRAPWVDYSGDLNDAGGTRRTVGVAIFDHPRNPHYPTHWHVRGYGLFAANPFGLADYRSGYRQHGDWTLAAGERATFRYRVLWHAGDAIEARVGERFLDWAAPPAVTVGD